MNEEIDIESWTDSLVGKTLDVFGPRLKLVGIQGRPGPTVTSTSC